MPRENETSREQELANFVFKNVNEIKRLIKEKPRNIPRTTSLDHFAMLMAFDPSNDRSKTLDNIATQIKQFLSVSEQPIMTNGNEQIFSTNQEGVTFKVTLHPTEKNPVGRGEIVVEPSKS